MIIQGKQYYRFNICRCIGLVDKYSNFQLNQYINKYREGYFKAFYTFFCANLLEGKIVVPKIYVFFLFQLTST